MPHSRSTRSRSQRSLTPFVIALGPLVCALALSAVGYALFRQEAQVGAVTRGSSVALSGPMEYTIILALAGALISLLVALVGFILYGRERTAAKATDLALAEVAERAEALNHVARRMAEHGAQRETAVTAWARRQRDAHALLSTLDARRLALQRVTGDIWAGVSNPGAPLDAATAFRLARESAVAASALGSELDELRAVMAASRASSAAIEAIDDTLVDDLIAVEQFAQETRHSLAVVAGSSAGASSARGGVRRSPSDALSGQDAGTAGRPAVHPEAMMADSPRIDTRKGAAIPPRPQPGISGAHPAVGRQPHAEPPAASGQLPVARGEAPNPLFAQSSDRWPFRPEDTMRQERRDQDGSSGRRPQPRDPEDSSSRWLND